MYLEGAAQKGPILRKRSQRKAPRAFLDCLGADNLQQHLAAHRIMVAHRSQESKLGYLHCQALLGHHLWPSRARSRKGHSEIMSTWGTSFFGQVLPVNAPTCLDSCSSLSLYLALHIKYDSYKLSYIKQELLLKRAKWCQSKAVMPSLLPIAQKVEFH